MVAPAVRPRGVRILRRALVAASGALLLLPAAAAAHLTGAHADGHGVSAKVRTVVGPGAVAADQGLYRVAPSVGEPVFTHGPDTRVALATREAPPATDGTGFSAGAVERRPACATDFYQRVIYLNPTSVCRFCCKYFCSVGRRNVFPSATIRLIRLSRCTDE